MTYRRYSITLALLIVALCALSIQAQSGRRQQKAPPAAPIPSPTPEPTPTPKKDDKEPDLAFLVGVDRHNSPASIPLAFHRAAQEGCADRLRKRSSADVDVPYRDMNRGEAIEKAKSSSNTYVVLLTLQYDIAARSYDDIQLEFVVFAPTTAKVMITGRSYINSSRVGPVIAGPTGRLPQGVFRESWLRQAGEDAADRILKKLDLGGTPPR